DREQLICFGYRHLCSCSSASCERGDATGAAVYDGGGDSCPSAFRSMTSTTSSRSPAASSPEVNAYLEPTARTPSNFSHSRPGNSPDGTTPGAVSASAPSPRPLSNSDSSTSNGQHTAERSGSSRATPTNGQGSSSSHSTTASLPLSTTLSPYGVAIARQ